MKTDTQHLDYLISQYIDGCLDTGSRKSLEQRLLNDPSARQLYKEQHDVQEVLDDWGNRIPMIHWDDFDQKLARRLENETVGGQSKSIFQRWAKPMSIAAALAVAASLGYGWHAFSMNQKSTPSIAQNLNHETPNRAVAVEPTITASDGSVTRFRVDEQPSSHDSVAANSVNITAPGNVEASESLKEGVAYGLTKLSDEAKVLSLPGSSSVHVAQAPTPSQPKKDESPSLPPAFP